MNNESFWKELGSISRIAPQDNPALEDQAYGNQQMDAIRLLRQGYRENLDLICAVRPVDGDPTEIAQLYTGTDNKRLLICFTSWENGHRFSSDATAGPIEVDTLPCRFVLGNMVNRSVFQGLIFDPGLGPRTSMVVLREIYSTGAECPI